MTDMFGRRPFKTVVREVVAELGGRAKQGDVVESVKHRMTMAEYQEWSESAFRRAVLNSSKTRSSTLGLDAVYGTGEEVSALRLFSPAEFEEKAREAARNHRYSRDLVYRLSDLCMEAHGLTFDADVVLSEEAAA